MKKSVAGEKTGQYAGQQAHIVRRKNRQGMTTLLQDGENLMSRLQRACLTLGGLALAVILPNASFGQATNTNYYSVQGIEFSPAGTLPGEQVHPAVAVNTSGGLVVWQDNITDGSGFGISAVWLDRTYTPTLGNFRINQQAANDQENPQAALLPGGGAAVVWQSGKLSFQHIMARFLGSNHLFLTTNDVMVNTATNHYQVNPALTVLTNGNLVVTWGSYGQDNSDGLQGVYGQILSPTGQKVGSEFLVNQFTQYNQRTPAVQALPNGGFVVAWVSELQRSSQIAGAGGVVGGGKNSVDIYARRFDSAGNAVTGEFLVNELTNNCANPAIGAASDGSYFITWSQRDSVTRNNGWDVWGRRFNSSDVGGTVQVINTQRYGDQYGPKIATVGTDYFVVWTSMGQDGSHEGVYGQFLHGTGTPIGSEIRVNTAVLNQQIHPAVSSDGLGQFLAVWSSYANGANSLDLKAQRYATTLEPLSPPGAPMVIALDTSRLSASWGQLAGFSVSYYELFVDGSNAPIVLTNNMWTSPLQSWSPATTHTFQLAYALTDGRVSPLSLVSSNTTWGYDNNFDGLPDDWETRYYGSDQSKWPANAFTVLAPGMTVLQAFLSGANPTDPKTWLKQWITQTPQGLFLNWNTIPGGIYQVQTTTDFKTWTNVGSPRFEAGTTDSIYLGLQNKGYYRVLRNRY